MALSETAICNSALSKLGAERILSLDANNDRARLLKEQYPIIRDEMLFGHPWNFAIKTQELALLTTTPAMDFDYEYQLPSDCLRVIGTDCIGASPWKVQGRKILCNYATLIIRYITNDQAYLEAPPAFTEALSAKIAAEISYSIVQNASLKETLMRDAEFKLRMARSFDAQESVGDRVYADSWLNERY